MIDRPCGQESAVLGWRLSISSIQKSYGKIEWMMASGNFSTFCIHSKYQRRLFHFFIHLQSNSFFCQWICAMETGGRWKTICLFSIHSIYSSLTFWTWFWIHPMRLVVHFNEFEWAHSIHLRCRCLFSAKHLFYFIGIASACARWPPANCIIWYVRIMERALSRARWSFRLHSTICNRCHVRYTAHVARGNGRCCRRQQKILWLV